MLDHAGYTKVIPVFIAPTTDWKSSQSQGWVKNFSVSMDIPGACPIPDAEFAYYVAYIGIYGQGKASYRSKTAAALEHNGVSAPAPASKTAATEVALQTAISAAVTAAGTEWTPGTWSDDGVMTASYNASTTSPER